MTTSLRIYVYAYVISISISLTGLLTVNSEIFGRILFSRIALNDIFATLKTRDYKCSIGHDLPTAVKGRVISPFREGFIFTKLRICILPQC